MGQQQQQYEHQGLIQEWKGNAKLFKAICDFISSPVEVWLRCWGTCGSRYFQFHACVGWLLMLFWGPLLFSQDDQRPLYLFWLATGALFFCHRLRGAWLGRRRTEPLHSRYSGWPIVSLILPFLREDTVKCGVEPVLTIVVGIVVSPYNPPLGSWLMAAGAGLMFSSAWQWQADRAEVITMQDAVERQRYIHELYKKEGRQ